MLLLLSLQYDEGVIETEVDAIGEPSKFERRSGGRKSPPKLNRLIGTAFYERQGNTSHQRRD